MSTGREVVRRGRWAAALMICGGVLLAAGLVMCNLGGITAIYRVSNSMRETGISDPGALSADIGNLAMMTRVGAFLFLAGCVMMGISFIAKRREENKMTPIKKNFLNREGRKERKGKREK